MLLGKRLADAELKRGLNGQTGTDLIDRTDCTQRQARSCTVKREKRLLKCWTGARKYQQDISWLIVQCTAYTQLIQIPARKSWSNWHVFVREQNYHRQDHVNVSTVNQNHDTSTGSAGYLCIERGCRYFNRDHISRLSASAVKLRRASA